MRGLIRSQFYSLRRECRLLVIVFACLALLSYLSSMLFYGSVLGVDENVFGFMMKASAKLGLTGFQYSIYGLIYILIAVGLFASRDLNDKTVNYEIMTGHDRRDIYISRAVICAMLGALGGIIMFAAVPVIDTIIYGWGGEIPVSTALIRILLLFLLYLRVSAELILISVVVRRTYLVYIIGVVAGLMELIAAEVFEGSRYVLALTASYQILNFSAFQLTHFNNKREVFFDSVMGPETVMLVITFYVLVTIGCLFYGSIYFDRTDLD